MLFDFVRAAFASPRTACTDLSRRLRDGVSLPLSLARIHSINDETTDVELAPKLDANICASIDADRLQHADNLGVIA